LHYDIDPCAHRSYRLNAGALAIGVIQVKNLKTTVFQGGNVGLFVLRASFPQHFHNRIDPMWSLDFALGGSQVQTDPVPAGQKVREVRS
jgi:hypothetical protein